jgi:CoA:oxalate CoA-transferase
MGSVVQLGELLGYPPLLAYGDPQTWFTQRDEIKGHLVQHLRTQPTSYWLSRLEPADYWCADVLTWPRLIEHEAFSVLQMIQRVSRSNGATLETTRCPIRIDGARLTSPIGAPKVGEHTEEIAREFELGATGG